MKYSLQLILLLSILTNIIHARNPPGENPVLDSVTSSPTVLPGPPAPGSGPPTAAGSYDLVLKFENPDYDPNDPASEEFIECEATVEVKVCDTLEEDDDFLLGIQDPDRASAPNPKTKFSVNVSGLPEGFTDWTADLSSTTGDIIFDILQLSPSCEVTDMRVKDGLAFDVLQPDTITVELKVGAVAVTPNITHAVECIPIELNTIGFSGSGGAMDNYYELAPDKNGLPPDPSKAVSASNSFPAIMPYKAPHWESNGMVNESVAFIQNTKPKVKVEFKLPTSDSAKLAKILVKGDTTDNVNFPEVSLTDNMGTIVYPITESQNSFPNAIKIYKKSGSTAFVINWQVSIDGGTTYTKLKETKHQIYLPWAHHDRTFKQESIYFHACKYPDGFTNDTPAEELVVVDGIFTEFTDRVVSRINPSTGADDLDPSGMGYWTSLPSGTAFSLCQSLRGFLELGTSTCGTWAEYMHEILNRHGITSTEVGINALMPGRKISNGGLVAADWQKILNDISTEFPSITNPGAIATIIPATATSPESIGYNYITPGFNAGTHSTIFGFSNNGDVNYAAFAVLDAPNRANGKFVEISSNFLSPLPGSNSPAQGNANARNWFGNHAILQYKTEFYDPSYGSPKQPSQNDYEASAFEYHGVLFRFVIDPINGAGGVPQIYVDRQDDPAVHDSRF